MRIVQSVTGHAGERESRGKRREKSCCPETPRGYEGGGGGGRKNVRERRGRWEERERERERETQRKSFKIAAGSGRAEIKAALYRLCSAVADSCTKVFLDTSPPPLFFSPLWSEEWAMSKNSAGVSLVETRVAFQTRRGECVPQRIGWSCCWLSEGRDKS